jgi:hypothetical protein
MRLKQHGGDGRSAVVASAAWLDLVECWSSRPADCALTHPTCAGIAALEAALRDASQYHVPSPKTICFVPTLR